MDSRVSSLHRTGNECSILCPSPRGKAVTASLAISVGRRPMSPTGMTIKNRKQPQHQTAHEWRATRGLSMQWSVTQPWPQCGGTSRTSEASQAPKEKHTGFPTAIEGRDGKQGGVCQGLGGVWGPCVMGTGLLGKVGSGCTGGVDCTTKQMYQVLPHCVLALEQGGPLGRSDPRTPCPGQGQLPAPSALASPQPELNFRLTHFHY